MLFYIYFSAFRVANKSGSHRKEFKLSELNDLLTHIAKQHIEALELYKKADALGRNLSTAGTQTLSTHMSEFNELVSLLHQGMKLIDAEWD